MAQARADGAGARTYWVALAAGLLLAIGCGGGKGAGADGGAGGAATGGGGSGGGTGAGGGAAGSAGTVLLQGEDDPATLVVDDTYLYWTTRTAVRRAPKGGGPATTLFSPVMSPLEMRADATSLYWTTTLGAQGIMSGAKTGGTFNVIVPGTIGHLAIDAESLYAVDGSMAPNVLFRAPKAGGTTTMMIASQSIFG